MALPRTHQSSFTPGEIEFVAGDELISIIPKMKMPRMTYIKVCEKKIDTRSNTRLVPVFFDEICVLKLIFIDRNWTFSTTFTCQSTSMDSFNYEEK